MTDMDIQSYSHMSCNGDSSDLTHRDTSVKGSKLRDLILILLFLTPTKQFFSYMYIMVRRCHFQQEDDEISCVLDRHS